MVEKKLWGIKSYWKATGIWNKAGFFFFFFFEWFMFLKTEWPIRGYCQIPSLSHHITINQEWNHCEYRWSLFPFPDLQHLLVYDLFFFFLITWAGENENAQSSIKSYFPHEHHTETAVITGEAKIENWLKKRNQKYHVCAKCFKMPNISRRPIIEKIEYKSHLSWCF